MKISGDYVFDAPRETVWRVLRDPDVLASALPGTQRLERVDENVYQGEMKVRIGPVGGKFGGKITLSDEVPPERYTMTVEGEGSTGFLKGVGNITLEALDDGRTRMVYAGEVQIGGRVASVGQRLFDSVSRSIIRQGLDKINQALQDEGE
ncbi:MAG: carbon monoxide dehydrogenase [Anaerolineae bacterium]|nr:MAG: carbon monoxide dehydrogenase [Anaerolineae bacterium]